MDIPGNHAPDPKESPAVDRGEDERTADAIRQLLRRVEDSFRELYLILVSIVQGVALGFLAFTVTSEYEDYGLIEWVRTTNGFLVVVLIWQEYMIASVAFAWVPTLLDSLLPFALGIAEISLILAIKRSPLSYSLLAATVYAIGFVASCNYLYHARRGFEKNRYSLEILRQHPRRIVFLAAVACAVNLLLFMASRWIRSTHEVDLAFSVLSLVPTVVFVLRIVFDFTLPIRAARDHYGKSVQGSTTPR
jgi:hypothetical protein